MSKRRFVIFAVICLVLAALVFLQFRTWRNFDWGIFLAETRTANPRGLILAVAAIYCVYYLRALRWKIFLRPVRKTSAASLTPPQFIGFTALALLGRPGEFIRPYLIARREDLPVSSQIAVWMVERIFDTGSVAMLLAAALLSGRLHTIPFFQENREVMHRVYHLGYILIGGVVCVGIIAAVVRYQGEALASWIEGHLQRLAPHLAHSVAQKVRQFGVGLNTIHDPGSAVQLVGISLLIWVLVGMAYIEVVKSYPNPQLQGIELPHVVLLMVSSMAGSVLQLPGIGGGSQLATIAVLAHIFEVPQELAVSCGIMLWVVTFMAVVPTGLVLAHREHVSLRELEKEAESEVKGRPPDPK